MFLALQMLSLSILSGAFCRGFQQIVCCAKTSKVLIVDDGMDRPEYLMFHYFERLETSTVFPGQHDIEEDRKG
jgi:hypothetical protein